MPVKLKKTNVPETVLYEIKIQEWWIECGLGISNKASKSLNSGQ